MKKITAILLFLCLTASLSACSGLFPGSHTEETVSQTPGFSHSLTASFDTRMYMGSSVLKVSAGQDNAQKVWYGGECWYVIGYDNSNMVTAKSGAVTLLLKSSFENTGFNGSTDSENSNAYSGSNLESRFSSWMKNISDPEQKAIIPRTIDGGSSNYNHEGYNANNVKGSSVTASLWPLSDIEAGQLGKAVTAESGSGWWLRSPGDADSNSQYIDGSGIVAHSGSPVTESLGARPAFYLDNSAILFTSAAESGKSTDEWKVTLKDDGTVSGLNGHGSFHVTNVTSCDGKILFITYEGASTGSNEYISVVIVNSAGEIRYYDALERVSGSAGTITLNIEGSLGGGDTIYLFNEQNNGDRNTSYSSGLNKIPVPSAAGHTWTEATCTEPRTCKVCGATEGSPKGHDWKEATCTEPKTCGNCGATEGSAKGHDWEIKSCEEPRVCKKCGAQESSKVGHDWKEATCTEPKTCMRCGVTEGEPLGHKWKDATCTEPRTCAVCKTTEGSALGHEWTDATCTDPKTCKRCGATEGSAKGHEWEIESCDSPKTCKVCGATEGDPVGHDWDEATCTAPRTCRRCKATEGEPLGHKWKEATCTDPKTCERCRATEGSALGHKWKNATCTEAKTCEVCGATEGDPFGHKWKEASCTEPRKCTVCGATEGEAPGHKWKDATCTAPKTCEKCGAKEGDPLGHDWKDATCTDPKKCSRCGATEGKALGHTPGDAVKENEKAATCEQKGSYDNVVYCKVCKAEISRETKTTAALGHSWDDGKITKNPACEEEGEKTFTCKNDKNHIKVEKIKALGHSWDDGKITKNPSCEEEGEKTFTCKNDSKHTKVEKVKAIGHSWDNGTVTKNPTCVDSGEKTYTCKNDPKHTKTEKVEALGHDWSEWKTTTAPGVNVEGVSTRYCSRCDATETMKIPPLNSHTLSFDTNGGSAIAAQNVVEGTKPVKPQDPVRDGFIFTGWYTDSACQTPFSFSNELTEDITVYAGWQEETPEIPDDDQNTPDIPDTPDVPDNENRVSPALIAAVAVPACAAGIGAAYYFINKKRLLKPKK